MGRLFWKFFLSIFLAQFAATVGIGGAIWLKNRNQQPNVLVNLDTSPPAEMAINAAAATLEYGGVKALKRMLENMDRHRVYAVDEQEHELLGRIVNVKTLQESRIRLKEDGKRRGVRQVLGDDGKQYLLFLPSGERQRGMDGDNRQLLANLGGGAQMAMKAASVLEGRDGREDRSNRPDFGPPGGGRPGAAPPGALPALDGAQESGPRGGAPFNPDSRGQGAARDNGDRPDSNFPGLGPAPGMQGGPDMGGDRPWGPRFQPLGPWVPIAAATAASLLFAVLLAWYFSRPIRALREAFDAAANGDLAPRFEGASGKSGTELNDLGRDFDIMTARLRSLIDGQTRLLHDVSHELRSPLARLQAAIGLAHQQPEKWSASMERIERESVRMDKLVGELLTLARLEAGAIKASQEEISMADLLDQIADDASYEAASQQRSVVQEGEADVQVIGQPDLLGRAIENVVRNAIKHSPEGGEVQLQVRALPEASQLVIRVLDHGPGVSPADLETIFQPFFRSSNASTEGHGLGLAIAQHVIEAHGGSIKATNRAGGGLCVEMILPVKR
ncbi:MULTISPECIES: ATP-binding protein [unclassified Duganella]|uniref:HAMP domain-containing sensor histidine kinase n=1 Tax=unclassified Duganella TaxID=2636909 RepID=UPI0008843E08|nr:MULTISPECIES: ATP-binding protein [unclassified Duganella]SDG57225.1 Signal transduction histidine kinase [Duganella sp. OV458]SDJ80216.1 Signal transduction histidine kinase [Duganella sp. OV510]